MTFNAGDIMTDVIIGLIVARIDIYCSVWGITRAKSGLLWSLK